MYVLCTFPPKTRSAIIFNGQNYGNYVLLLRQRYRGSSKALVTVIFSGKRKGEGTANP